MANMRAAKAAAVAEYLNDDSTAWTAKYYDAGKGVLTTTRPAGYGKGTTTVGSDSNSELGYNPRILYTGEVIKITAVSGTDGVTMEWE